MTNKNDNKPADLEVNAPKKTLTLGGKSKEELLKKVQEKQERFASTSSKFGSKSIGIKTKLGDLPSLKKDTQVSVAQDKATVIPKDDIPTQASVEEGLTNLEKQNRLKALELSKTEVKKPTHDPVASFQEIEQPAFKTAPTFKVDKDKKTHAPNSDVEEEVKPVKKRALLKRKDKNEHEGTWKSQYYDEEESLSDVNLTAYVVEDEVTPDVVAAPIVKEAQGTQSSYLQYGFHNNISKRSGKTRRDRQTTGNKESRTVTITGRESLKTLAHSAREKLKDFFNTLKKLEIEFEDENTVLDIELAEIVLLDLGHKVDVKQPSDILDKYKTDNKDSLVSKPPVVTIMGHVDHGKTTLLDYIRNTNIASKESGGITQHIGAYQISTKNGGQITFLDTPGHEAFAEMRARGALVTDIIVLVVAADDGLKPQTIEVINHAKNADVPIIVAINKMDKPGTDPMKVKTELLQYDVVVEDLGGKVQSVPVSAIKGTGVEDLLEAISLEAEVLELKANPNRTAIATIIESRLDKGKGIVATAIIKNGTLRQGDMAVVNDSLIKIRFMHNDKGQLIKEATPGMPVEIVGFSKEARAGDELLVVNSEEDGNKIIDYYTNLRDNKASEEEQEDDISLLMQVQGGDKKELPVIIKTDVYGSKEAIASSLLKIGNEEVKARILHSGVGAINESDVLLAKTSKAIIYGFNVRANNQVSTLARDNKISIRYFSIIYDLLEDAKDTLSGMLQPKVVENIIGYANIKEVFNISKVGKIAGCIVTEGVVKKSSGVRILRDGVVIHEGLLSQLKHYKDEVKEVRSGKECGIALQNFQDILEGDVLECFEKVSTTRSL